jgi:hypothetical protein
MSKPNDFIGRNDGSTEEKKNTKENVSSINQSNGTWLQFWVRLDEKPSNILITSHTGNVKQDVNTMQCSY